MPKLFDLIPEKAKKELLEEARKAGKSEKKTQKNRHFRERHGNAFLKVPDFVALDVETTGLDFKKDRIIEIGAIRYINGAFGEEFSTFINAGIDIPQHITDLTGIEKSQTISAPSFGEIADKLIEFIGKRPLCGHQIEFDLTFINEELKRIGKPVLSIPLLDTALLSRILLQQSQRFSLKSVSEFLNVTLDNAHRALYDARASGEVAVKLVPKLAELPAHIRQTMAACSPGSLFKNMIIKTLGNLKPSVRVGVQRNYKQNNKLSFPDEFKQIEKASVSEMFFDNGLLKKNFELFKPRESQKEMAQEIADAFNTQSILVAEAGTGIGKTLAYLLPSAFWAIKNKCRVLVSTRTRNLQDQLIIKDLPLVDKITDNKLKYSVLKGRSNYICLNRWKKLLSGEIGNISPRERFAILPLIPWVETTQTGDIEEQNQFNPKWFGKIWNLISAESHQCTARKCPEFSNCFFQQARMRASGSHIVVINHALFFSDVCSENSILGKTGSIIFDEAHHLESCGHKYLRVEFDTNRLNLFLDTINNLVLHAGKYKDEPTIYHNGKELRTNLKRFRKKTQLLLEELDRWAYSKSGTGEYQMAYGENAFDSFSEILPFELGINQITDCVHSLKQSITGHTESEKFETLEVEAQSCYEKASQLKADFQYLAAAKTEEHVFWIEGNHGKRWTKLCGVTLDIGTFLSDIWEKCNGAVIFTSATLSVSESFDYFKRAVGLGAHEKRTVTSSFKSPFSTSQMIMGSIKNAPELDDTRYPEYVAETITDLHLELKKNILVLFTANSMLKAVWEILRGQNRLDSKSILAQGISGTRQNLLEQFKQNSKMILLGADSFWEGIDAPGEACEIVIIPRLPFPVPTHPVTQAVAKRFESIGGESFFSYSVPEAIIRFRQGSGRLIRSPLDTGALIVLDSRIIHKGYGKRFVRSLDGNFMNFEDIKDMVLNVRKFFDSGIGQQESNISYVPLEEV